MPSVKSVAELSQGDRLRYGIKYKFIDFDAEEKIIEFKTWKEACLFMRSLLRDGYVILSVWG